MQKLVFIFSFSFLTLFTAYIDAAPVYIAKDSRTYHYDRNCSDLNATDLIEFASPQKADNAGAIPCGHCNLTTGKLNDNVRNVLPNPVITNGSLGEFRHGTFPSPPLGEFTHVGVDLVAPCGTNILTFADGQVKDVIDSTNDKNYKTLGYMVLIEHSASLIGKKFYTLYLHMQSPPEVKMGDPVTGGSTVIGKVGDTGKTLGGCHTHFEIRYFPERFSTWGNIYGPGDQRASEYFKQNWENPLTFFKNYPNGLKLVKSTQVDSNEGVYVGDLVDGVRHGHGTITWPNNGGKYVGEFKDGKMHGQGTNTSPDGYKYVGGFKDDKYHGQGTETWPDGNKYVGEWKDNKMHGQGTHTWGNGSEWVGDKYVGEWKDGKEHGQGTYTWSDGRKYVGEWRNGKRTGQGIHTWPNGDKYVGKWKDSKRQGQGTYTWSNGNKYVGDYKNGKENGWGTFTWNDGDKHVGENKDGKANGQGTLTYSNGEKYIGEFKNNKRHGQGTHTWPDGRKYVGEWRDDMTYGQGTQTFPDGSKYVGEWKDGKQHGQGTYTYANGNKYVGEWKYGNRYDSSLDVSIQSFSIKGLKIGMSIQQARMLYPEIFRIRPSGYRDNNVKMEDGSNLSVDFIEPGAYTKEGMIYEIIWESNFRYSKNTNDVLMKLQKTYGKWNGIYRDKSNYYYVIWDSKFKNHTTKNGENQLFYMVRNDYSRNDYYVTDKSYLIAWLVPYDKSESKISSFKLLLRNYKIYDDAKAAEATRIKQQEALNNLELR